MKNFILKLTFLGLVAAASLFTASLTPARADLGISFNVGIAPPPLPVYDQPPLPGPGYIWTPGYWAWDDGNQDYYWVPGEWVMAPEVGYLWTPAWWSFDNGYYRFHDGYWGQDVGYYGGIAYGYGYDGHGYHGGYWRHNQFYYNRQANNLANARVAHVYSRAVASNRSSASFNGPGGVNARATAAEQRAGRESHVAATSTQTRHLQAASANPASRFSTNHGRPAVANASQREALPRQTSAATGTHVSSFHDSAFTGENRASVSSAGTASTHRDRAVTGPNAASVNARHETAAVRPQTHTGSFHSSAVSGVSHRSTASAGAFHPVSHAAVSQPHFQSHASSAVSHAAAPHSQGGGARASAPHASVSHSSGGGGGGRHH